MRGVGGPATMRLGMGGALRGVVVAALAVALVAAGALAAACGGRSVSGAPSGDAATRSPMPSPDAATPSPDAAIAAIPLEHRSAASACPTDRPPGNGSSFMNPTATANCQADSACTRGQNGRCVAPEPFGPMCTYDECFADGDCDGGAVCACRNEPLGNNVCLQSGCRIDSDCTAGYCSPSYGYCRYDGVVQYACHTAADLCVNDTDCPDNPIGPMLCSFDSSQGHWACVNVACPL